MTDKRNRLAAVLLALCFPFLGAHRFYCGNVWAGVATVVTPFIAAFFALVAMSARQLPVEVVYTALESRSVLAAAVLLAASSFVISGLYLLSISDSTFEQDHGGSYPGSAYGGE